jgi:YYY domain-containing protein
MPQLMDFIAWYLIVGAAGILALPLTFQFFKHIPDRGYCFSKIVGILVPGYVFWLLGSFGFVFNDNGGLLLGTALTTGLGLVWLGKAGLAELWSWLKQQRSAALAVEVVFLAAFVLWAVVRAYNPNIEGTEKPMEFMFINSVLRSPSLPPHDAWLSGHAISYYYFGYFLVAALTRLAGTDAGVAFNLGISLLFALTAVASLGVAMNLISLAQRRAAHLSESLRPALLAPVLVLLVGNYYGLFELFHNNGLLPNAQIPAVWYDFGQAPSSGQPQSLQEFEYQPGIRAGTINLWRWLDLKQLNQPPTSAAGPFRWDLRNWFFAARVVHDRNLIGMEVEAIDENPAFSFLLADMHPHVLALPFAILASGLALEWLLWAKSKAGNQSLRRKLAWSGGPRLLFSGSVLGGLAFLNTWDFPIYLFLTVIAVAMGTGLALGWRGLVRRWHYLSLFALLLALTSVLLYLPFYLTLQSQAGGILPNLIFPTRFQQTVVHFGPVMAGVTLFLIWASLEWRSLFNRRAAWLVGLGLPIVLAIPLVVTTLLALTLPEEPAQVLRFIQPLRVSEALSLLWQRRLIDSLAAVFPAVLIGLSIGLITGFLNRYDPGFLEENHRVTEKELTRKELPMKFTPENTPDESPPHLHKNPQISEKDEPPSSVAAVLMALGMILTGALLLIGPEFVYLRDLFGTRMNTIFKFYFQVWALWAIAGSFGIWYIMRRVVSRSGKLAVGLAVLAILPGLVYLPGSLMSKTGGFAGPVTLNGMDYFSRFFPDDYAAIQWLQENIEGRPVILEGSRGSYWIEGRSSRISMATGLPTLVGWIGHQQQWRGEYYERVKDRPDQIAQIYRSRSWEETQILMEQHKIEYVIISHLERSWYDPVYMPKFEIYMDRVFDQGDVVIFRQR